MNEALMLLGVGMITVFIILTLVVLLGNLLIILVNRFIPEKAKIITKSTENISNKKLAAIVAAVDIVTKGRGKVTGVVKQ
jgi:oxaloacetate decarboxylase gamma subunit